MIREVIVVEGKNDIAAVRRAVEAECLTTGGFALNEYTLRKIEAAYKRNGIIILTDPDSAGELIRKKLAERFPEAKHAFVPREAASTVDDIGIEQAAPTAILAALTKVRCQEFNPVQEFSTGDLMDAGLVAGAHSSARRAALGQTLGIGYANAKTFLRRLNIYGVTREEFVAAVAALEANHD